ncbi:MAG TPA: hypothetical protein VH703_06860 [Solirubrobacterales bacterium]|jgi:uncharacterized protein YbjT (DUF2867 family)
MARALIVGCGCRGCEVGERLLAEGWQVRGTSRRADGLARIEAAGIEAARADPARPATILGLVGDVATLVWMLGSAEGEHEEVAALHGASLERVLAGIVETPVRRFVYESGGSVDAELLDRGAAIARAAAGRWRIPIEVTGRQIERAKLGWELR